VEVYELPFRPAQGLVPHYRAGLFLCRSVLPPRACTTANWLLDNKEIDAIMFTAGRFSIEGTPRVRIENFATQN